MLQLDVRVKLNNCLYYLLDSLLAKIIGAVTGTAVLLCVFISKKYEHF